VSARKKSADELSDTIDGQSTIALADPKLVAPPGQDISEPYRCQHHCQRDYARAMWPL